MQTRFPLNGKEINLTSEEMKIASNNLNIDKYGNIKLKSANGTNLPATSFEINPTSGYVKLKEYYNKISLNNSSAGIEAAITVGDASSGALSEIGVSNRNSSAVLSVGDRETPNLSIGTNGGSWSYVYPSYMKSGEFRNSSLESLKKNIEKYNESAINIIKNTEIYTYNFNTEKNEHKKHIGLIIPDKGGDYKTPKQIISEDGQGVEQYSMTSIAWKAIQELIQENKKLTQKIEEIQKEIKGGKNAKD